MYVDTDINTKLLSPGALLAVVETWATRQANTWPNLGEGTKEELHRFHPGCKVHRGVTRGCSHVALTYFPTSTVSYTIRQKASLSLGTRDKGYYFLTTITHSFHRQPQYKGPHEQDSARPGLANLVTETESVDCPQHLHS